MKQKYIIVGDNNFWYTTTDEVTPEELQKEIDSVREGIMQGDYNYSAGLKSPNELFAYPINGTPISFK